MNKSKYFTFIVVMAVIIMLAVGNWVTTAQADNTGISTPVPTGTPVTIPGVSGEPAPAELQEELKSVIQAYFEIRYRALSVSYSEDFQANGFGDLVSAGPDAKDFLLEP